MSDADVAYYMYRTGVFFMDEGLPLLVESLVWVLHAVLFITAMSLIRNKKSLRHSRWLLCSVVGSFVLPTTALALSAYNFFHQIKRIMLEAPSPGTSILQKSAAAGETTALVDLVLYVIWLCELVWGDMIVMWRAWALWRASKLVFVLPFLCWAGAIALLPVTSVCMARVHSPDGSIPSGCMRPFIASWTLSASANAISTLLIGYIGWKHASALKTLLGEKRKHSTAEKILFLLTEAGALYFVIVVINLALDLTSETVAAVYGPGLIIYNITLDVIAQLFPMFPTLTVCLVICYGSLWDHSQSVDLPTISRLQFASSPGVVEAGVSDTSLSNRVVVPELVDAEKVEESV